MDKAPLIYKLETWFTLQIKTNLLREALKKTQIFQNIAKKGWRGIWKSKLKKPLSLELLLGGGGVKS